MLVRVAHYFHPFGGPTRFMVEMIRALDRRGSGIDLEVVTQPLGVPVHHDLLEAHGIDVPVVGVKARNQWAATEPTRVRRLRGTGRLRRYLGAGTHTYYELPRAVFDGCDLVWLPWAHRHRVPASCAHRTLATLHDLILVQFEEEMKQQGLDPRMFGQERETLQQWLASPARLVVTSGATVGTMRELVGAPAKRFEVIRILAGHVPPRSALDLPPEWDWAQCPFVLCPANVAPHKNHGSLIQAMRNWGAVHPLVLTGLNSDLANVYGAGLREAAEDLGLQIGKSLIPLGYVSDDVYFSLLHRAWAVVMPTLMEGGGSYPVLEAMLAGIPVLCSDIPVMREQMEETGGTVLWFDPHDPQDLARRLRELEGEYGAHRRVAEEQVDMLRVQTWEEVAASYESVMRSMVEQPQFQQRREETLA